MKDNLHIVAIYSSVVYGYCMITFLFSAVRTFLAIIIVGCVAFYALQLVIMILGFIFSLFSDDK